MPELIQLGWMLVLAGGDESLWYGQHEATNRLTEGFQTRFELQEWLKLTYVTGKPFRFETK